MSDQERRLEAALDDARLAIEEAQRVIESMGSAPVALGESDRTTPEVSGYLTMLLREVRDHITADLGWSERDGNDLVGRIDAVLDHGSDVEESRHDAGVDRDENGHLRQGGQLLHDPDCDHCQRDRDLPQPATDASVDPSRYPVVYERNALRVSLNKTLREKGQLRDRLHRAASAIEFLLPARPWLDDRTHDAEALLDEIRSGDGPGHDERDDGEKCQDCGTRYNLVWWAPAPLWTQVTDRPHASPGLYCLVCFTGRAADRGLLLKWVPEIMDNESPEPADEPGHDASTKSREDRCNASFTDRNDEHVMYVCELPKGHAGWEHREGLVQWTGPSPDDTPSAPEHRTCPDCGKGQFFIKGRWVHTFAGDEQYCGPTRRLSDDDVEAAVVGPKRPIDKNSNEYRVGFLDGAAYARKTDSWCGEASPHEGHSWAAQLGEPEAASRTCETRWCPGVESTHSAYDVPPVAVQISKLSWAQAIDAITAIDFDPPPGGGWSLTKGDARDILEAIQYDRRADEVTPSAGIALPLDSEEANALRLLLCTVRDPWGRALYERLCGLTNYVPAPPYSTEGAAQ